jgi:hypothetical protein
MGSEGEVTGSVGGKVIGSEECEVMGSEGDKVIEIEEGEAMWSDLFSWYTVHKACNCLPYDLYDL